MKHLLMICSLSFLCLPALGALPKYGKPKILARANGNSNYNLPRMTFLSNVTPVINNQGDVAFKLMAIEGQTTQGLWFKGASENEGRITYRAPQEMLMSDPSLNDQGQAAFSVSDEGTSEGLFIFDFKTLQTQQVFKNDNKDIIAFVYPSILNDGRIYFRGTHTTEDHSLQYLQNGLHKVVSEGEPDLGFKASYLFGPAINQKHQTALKIRLGEKKEWGNEFPDQILLLEENGSSRIVAHTQKTDSNSRFIGLGNSVALSENGLIAFVGILENGGKTLVLDAQGTQMPLATEGLDDISELELFSPQINSQGFVLFRAKDGKGRRGIYLAEPGQIQRVLGEGDPIPSDLGPAFIKSDAIYPAFSAGLSLNEKSEFTCHILLVSETSGQDLGSAIYKLSPL
jgi:hypothetical protein